MPLQPKRWSIAPPIPEDLQEELPFHKLLQQLLYNRGIVDAEMARAYVSAEGSLYDPFLIKDMEIAVERLYQALNRDESITVYGDYDADGVTATAMLLDFLSKLGANVKSYTPDRFDEGYGLNKDAIREIAEDGTNLLITVDCGIRSVGEVELAVELGMDVLLTDHHLPGDVLPPAVAILDHKQEDDTYPEKVLCGAGIAYKLIEAYLSRYPYGGLNARDWLDLVAIATVADIVPLTGENRALIKAGLAVIQEQKRIGLTALIRAAGQDPASMKASHIAFGVGPRINAAGRIASARNAIDLLLTQDSHSASLLAQQLDDINARRKDKTAHVQELVEEDTNGDGEEPADGFLIFTVSPDFHMGVVGLAAGRLSERYYRPAVAGAMGERLTRASCRSIPEFHITRALDECADLFDESLGERYGGHAAAAGFTISNDKLPQLEQRLTELAEEDLAGRELIPTVQVDVDFNFTYLIRNKQHIYRLVQLLEPTGTENPPVLFAARGLRVVNAFTVGKDHSHLRLKLSDGYTSEDAIAFRMGHLKDELPPYVDILFTLDENTYRGQTTFQIQVRDIREAEMAD
ncbi:MAG: single-stranded-DNA-specific exonuclease RecJ [Anaerolineae bacterium]|jgi:single-stranded-DNA-specific exonuclease|nr:single-stranded-DNA-specific exonuclease RecJ [Anaerolineae bacterium]